MPVAAESLRHEGVLVKTAFLVAVGMDPAGLGKDEFSDQWFVGRDTDTGDCLDIAADMHELTFVERVSDLQMVVQDAHEAGDRQVAGALSEAVDCRVETLDPGFDGLVGIGGREVIVVMGMEVEMHLGIALHHLAEILYHLQGVHHAQRVGQHETGN